MRRGILEHLRTRPVSRIVYGSIIVLAVILVLERHPPSAGEALASVLGTAVAVGLAELYSELLGHEVRTGRRITRADVVEALDDVVAVAFGIGFPAIFFVLALFDVLTVDRAIDISKWTGLGLIAFYAFCGARLSGRRWVGAVLEAAAVCAIGAFLVGLKAVAH